MFAVPRPGVLLRQERKQELPGVGVRRGVLDGPQVPERRLRVRHQARQVRARNPPRDYMFVGPQGTGLGANTSEVFAIVTNL